MPKDHNKPHLRVALAGCGAIAPLHLNALRTLDNVELVTLVDPDPAAAGRLLARWQDIAAGGGPLSCRADLAEALVLDQLDVVHICTPHHTHVPLACLALDHDAHVLLEKPPAITCGELEQLSSAVSRSGSRLGICFQNRYNPAAQQARHLLQSGKIGAVRAARAFVTWKRDADYYRQAEWRGRWASEGGGVMINQAIHTLDLLIWLAGRPVQVEGTIANRHLREVIEVEDTAEMRMTLENRATALFYATTAYGADAPVFLELDCGDVRLRLEGDSLQLLDEKGIPLRPDRLSSWLAEPPSWHPDEADDVLQLCGKDCWGQGHQRLIGAFYASLQDRQHAFLVDLESGSQALRALLALYESARTGLPVSL